MKTDVIAEVGIDAAGRLYIKPATQKFSMIWREGAEVHWDEKAQFLFSPKPREWSYAAWYRHIIWVAQGDGNGVLLSLTPATRWTNVPAELRQQLIELP
jgi:hypothetical protein